MEFKDVLFNYLAQIEYQTGEELTPAQLKAVMDLALRAFHEYEQYKDKE